MKSHVALVNYGAGNLKSVQHAFEFLGSKVSIIEKPSSESFSHIILPGVGSFRRAMKLLKISSLDDYIKEKHYSNVPILGICLGMQLLCSRSSEDGETQGLGLIDGDIDRFSFNLSTSDLKIPHVGFSTIKTMGHSRLFGCKEQEIDFYFTHSFRLICNTDTCVAAKAWHGETFVPAVEKNLLAGTQFHPEKSQKNGLTLLRNFLVNFNA